MCFASLDNLVRWDFLDYGEGIILSPAFGDIDALNRKPVPNPFASKEDQIKQHGLQQQGSIQFQHIALCLRECLP